MDSLGVYPKIGWVDEKLDLLVGAYDALILGLEIGELGYAVKVDLTILGIFLEPDCIGEMLTNPWISCVLFCCDF